MSVDRRTFIKSSISSGAALVFAAQEVHAEKSVIDLPTDFRIKIMATNWGFDGSIESFAAKAKQAGYDGVELGWPSEEGPRQQLFAALKANALEVGYLIGVWDLFEYQAHLTKFEKLLRQAAASQPLYINCHAGRDYFTVDQNKAFIDLTNKVHQETGVPIYHETHRGRILYSTPIAKTYIEKFPDLRLTLDISHWCAVHESLLADQSEAVDLALKRTDHIHARVGHPEGPQVNDPRAPEWKSAVDAHLSWWDKVIKQKIETGARLVTFLTEFGPPDYLPTIPYTRQPVANQWDINVYMLQLLRARYR